MITCRDCHNNRSDQIKCRLLTYCKLSYHSLQDSTYFSITLKGKKIEEYFYIIRNKFRREGINGELKDRGIGKDICED